MSLETGTYISDLVPTNPDPTDSETYGAQHLQLIKSVLKNTFAGITGAVTATHPELNMLHGKTTVAQISDIQAAQFATALPAQTPAVATCFVSTNGASAQWAFLFTDPWVFYSIANSLRANAFSQ